MTITMSAVYENGTLRLAAPLNIQERATVQVTIEEPALAATDDPTGWKAIDALRGIVKGAPRDVSTHHDKYLYGEHGEVIFLDTGFLFAYVSEDDENHDRVCEVLDSHHGRRLGELLLTTNHVVAETITLLNVRGHRDPGMSHDLAVRVGEQLFAGTLGRIHQATIEEEQAAFAYFTRHRDKRYSFVDCLSFVVMEKLGIREAWAVDSDFTHRFIARPGPA